MFDPIEAWTTTRNKGTGAQTFVPCCRYGQHDAAVAVLSPRSPRIIPFARMGDEALASRAAAGSAAAFTALYERYYEPLLGYCRSILLNAEDAHDATQSALENALRALPRREPGRALKPWLYRIAHNEAINIVRRRQPDGQRRRHRRPADRPRPGGRRRAAQRAWPSSSTTCGCCPSASAARSSCASSAG